jgi:DNA polymerase/3'-5' exonuclease PolX
MNTNRDIAEVLRDVVAKKGAELRAMTDSEARQKLRFGIRAIDSAADQIDALDWQLTDPAQALNIPGVGKKIAARVAEFLRTGKLQELDGFQVDRGEVVPRELLTVYGIGPERAQALAQEGIVTVDLLKRAVRRKLVSVPGSTERALQYHDDLQQKIPRTEMRDFEVLLQGVTEQVAPGATAMVLGSYRRGAQASSDIDLLVTRPRNVQGLLQDVVRALSAEGLVRACLSSGETKYHGIVALSRRHPARRIDIRAVEYGSRGTAQMYFTGSKRWNVRIRALALRRGMTLNEYSLVRKSDGRRVTCPDEAAVFRALDTPYVPPDERN